MEFNESNDISFWLGTFWAESSDSIVLFADLSLGEFIDILVLGSCVDHSPSLFPHFPHLVEDRNILVVSHHQSDQSHHHESASSSHSCTAMYNRHPIVFELI